MINIVCHLADIHIRKSPARHEEYSKVFQSFIKNLKTKNPDRIVIVGDLFHDYIDLQPEVTILAARFLNELATIAPVRITRGNHDIRKKSLKRIDSIEAIVNTINNPNVIYYNETGFFDDDNVTWAVWKHGEKNNSPWNKKKKPTKGNVVVDLFHDPIQGAISPTNFEFNNQNLVEPKHFKGDLGMFGDIHLQQILSPTQAYSSSLIEQNFSEGDGNFHGYLLWDLTKKSFKTVEIKNEYSYNTVKVNTFTDFDELDIELENPTKINRVRVVWNTLPQSRTTENQRKVKEYLSEKYNIEILTNKNEFLEDEDMDDADELQLENIVDQATQHEIFKTYLEKIGTDDETIQSVIELDDEIASRIEPDEFTNIQWSILKLTGTNFMSYESLNIDWEDNNGLYQITGLNTAGKTTIMKLITYVLYNKTRETESRVKFGDSRYVNNRNGAKFCEGTIVIDINGQYFGIRRTTTVEINKQGELKGAPTVLEFYKLSNPNEEFSDDNSLSNMVEDDRDSTQAIIEKGIGSYDNFMRVVMTTSDTLNEVLSSDRSVFIDSLLKDSGLDIFDTKLNAYKDYLKDEQSNSKPRVNCNIDKASEEIENLKTKNEEVNKKIDNISKLEIPNANERILKGNDYISDLIKKLNKIDESIYNLNIDDVLSNNKVLLADIDDYLLRKSKLENAIGELRENYDKEKHQELINKKELHRDGEFQIKSKIKDIESEIYSKEREIESNNGIVFRLKQNGKKLKHEISELKDSKICVTCGQKLDSQHQYHIDEKIKSKESEMYLVANEIKSHDANNLLITAEIKSKKDLITAYINEIEESSINLDGVLAEIGEIQNQINDVDKRKELVIELDKIDPQIEMKNLRIDNNRKTINLYNDSLKQIEENKKIELGVEKAKERVQLLNDELQMFNDSLYGQKSIYTDGLNKINNLTQLIIDFEKQEKYDNIHKIYKQCIHRDGIPSQLLKSYAIPKINAEAKNLLEGVDFDIWLDEDDLKLKLTYGDLKTTIDAISGSGKERTFASVCLKFALNQINAKSKPTIFLLDEVMGKLTEDSVDEFINILDCIKQRVQKILVVEHNHEICPDFIIKVEKNDKEISSFTIE